MHFARSDHCSEHQHRVRSGGRGCAAGSSSESDTVDLTGLSGSIAVASVLPNISSDMTVNGPGPATLTIQRTGSNFPIFFIDSSATAAISGLAVQGGEPTSFGFSNFGISNGGNLSLINCAVSGFGLGVRNGQRTLTISNCTVNGNLNGGGITNGDGTINVFESVISGNDSRGGFGPAIDNSFGTINVTNSTISGNSGHNAIMNGVGATATFVNSTVSNNAERGILNNGTLTMIGGSITGNANGGIILSGNSVMIGVTVANNSNSGGTAHGGGGIFSGGNSNTIINCLVTNNFSSLNGGGIRNAGHTTIINTTISGNTSNGLGGGLDQIDGGFANFLGINLTITNNRAFFGGGVFQESGPMKFRNSIIAGNFLLNGTSPSEIGGVVDATSSFNLVGPGGTGGLTNGENNNQVVADPRLGPLANNGGPTQTHSLLSNSPALDAADNCVTEVTHCGDPRIPQVTTDQRGSGFNRIVDGPDGDASATVDIGAYETQLPLASLPNTATNEDTQLVAAFDAGDTSTITSITATSSNSTLVPNDSAHLSAALAGTTGVITINPATNLFGTTDVTVTVNRTGGSDVKTFTLTVNSSNDAPSFTKGPNQTILEDAGPQTVANWATNLSVGPADEAGQALSFQVTGNTNAALFSSGPAISPSGTLTYTPAANAFGTATITVVAKDTGGTANAGVDTSPAQTFVITITPVNDVPFFTKGPDQVVNEDAGTFVSWATNVSTGAPNENQALTFEVTGNTNPGLFSGGPSVTFQGFLGFIPAPDANGSATISVRLKDNGGTANGGVDTSAVQSFTITLRPVNDRPTLTLETAPNVSEDSGPQTIENWATDFSPGPPDEAGQTLSLAVTNFNEELFSVQPALSSAGTLTFTPAPNASGLAFLEASLKDNGGTANGGQDTFAQGFVIVINAVNDPPVNTVPGAQSMVKNSLLIFSTIDGNRISIADVDAANSAVQVTLSTSNGLLTLNGTTGLTFSAGTGTGDSTMTFSGTVNNINAALNGLRFAPAVNFEGAAQIQIATNDLGRTGSGGAQSDTDAINVTVVDGNALQFSASSYAVVEGSESVTITVTRIGSGGAASVNYSTSDGNATGGGSCGSGADYVSQSGTLSWAAGETTAKTFTIPICEDLLNEPDETVNLTLNGVTGGATLGMPRNAVLTIVNAGPPVLLTEENTEHSIALDSLTATRDPFSLTYPFTFSPDNRRSISLFVWRLALRPTDSASNLTVVAEDSEGRVYPLTVEFVGATNNPPLVTQVVVRLPGNVVGAPRDLFVTVQLRGSTSNRAFIKIAGP